ncbi:MAG: hypothetical protein H7644_07940 [Candidatus Heimdallarchaeota archaeon]|nr:hypothetical protein [Candidatus Heimdallarchaeota archaeon]MCK5143683.1 hypothetical protein [Candidatus Heimdallarchaeota archaeon]
MKTIFNQRKSKFLFLLFFSLLSISLILALSYTQAKDDDDDGIGLIGDDLAKDIGTIAIGLFAAGMLNVIVLFVYKFTRKFLNDEGKTGKIKRTTREVYLKTRKPLNYLHYLLTLAATTIIILHGIEFIQKEQEVGIFGWVAVGIFLFYIVTGAIIKLKIKPLWTSKKGRSILNKLHRSLLILLIVIAVHIVHVLLTD